jgi:hypothetical protein
MISKQSLCHGFVTDAGFGITDCLLACCATAYRESGQNLSHTRGANISRPERSLCQPLRLVFRKSNIERR